MSDRGQFIAHSMGAIFLSLLLIESATAKNSHYDSHRIAKMQMTQAGLISKGMRTGQLTDEETRSLLREQKYIRQLELRYRKDKVLGSHETNILITRLRQAAYNINREMYDNDRRPRLSKHGALHH